MDRLLLLAGVLLSMFYMTFAYDFYVGGKQGWVVNPQESYDLWAVNMRFQVHDKLVFKYKKGDDSVLEVKKEDYYSCNTNNPIKKFDDGDTVFLLDRSGPFFFISGKAGHCAQGQKIVVVVMAVRISPSPAPSPSPSPAPSANSVSPIPSPTPSSAIGLDVSKVYFGVLALLLAAVMLG